MVQCMIVYVPTDSTLPVYMYVYPERPTAGLSCGKLIIKLYYSEKDNFNILIMHKVIMFTTHT